MKSDLRKIKKGDTIWTIQEGWAKVSEILEDSDYPIKVESYSYTLDGKLTLHDKYPSAFLEYPFKELPIEKDTLVWFRDSEDENWMVGYYSHSQRGNHYCFDYSKKSTQTIAFTHWEIVTTENPLL